MVRSEVDLLTGLKPGVIPKPHDLSLELHSHLRTPPTFISYVPVLRHVHRLFNPLQSPDSARES
ncbi:MAG: hypothetical protein SAJ12_16510, partial [Jaaginema sp. PMC 1079.18]|nr:hypothetical protein [Jaaginema sp. PMC 1079.18]